jgi:hypothetical protein
MIFIREKNMTWVIQKFLNGFPYRGHQITTNSMVLEERATGKKFIFGSYKIFESNLQTHNIKVIISVIQTDREIGPYDVCIYGGDFQVMESVEEVIYKGPNLVVVDENGIDEYENIRDATALK